MGIADGGVDAEPGQDEVVVPLGRLGGDGLEGETARGLVADEHSGQEQEARREREGLAMEPVEYDPDIPHAEMIHH